jgi:hypothetical protein
MEWVHSTYGENISFRGTTRFRSIPQPNTKIGSRCETVPFYFIWFWTEHTPNARPQTLRCTGAWWPESSPQREGKQERKLETGTSRSIHHGERMCPVHSPNVWPHGWCRLKICNSGLCRRNEIWSLLCRICCQLLAVGGRTAGDFAEEERVRR